MSSDKIKMNYAAMDEMAAHCQKVAERLLQTVELGKKVASEMNNGALVGETGSTFAAALSGPFATAIGKLSAKFGEEAEDIKKAIEDMKKADSSAGAQF